MGLLYDVWLCRTMHSPRLLDVIVALSACIGLVIAWKSPYVTVLSFTSHDDQVCRRIFSRQ